jgi:putative heme transporter
MSSAGPATTASSPQDDPLTAVPSSRGIPPTLVTWAGGTWRILVILGGLVALFYGIGLVSTVVIALFLAAFFTALATPIMNLFRRILPRVIALIASIVFIAIAIVVVLGIVVRSVINEGPALSNAITTSFDNLQTWASGPPLNLSNDDFSKYVGQAETWLKDVVESFAAGAFGSIGDIVIGGSVFIFGVIFFMSNPRGIWNFVVSWIPRSARDRFDVSGHLAWDSLSGYTRGIVVVALADATLVFIGLLILQVPLAPALAAIVFFGAFIPVIGAPIATFFAAIIALAERGPVIALLVVALTIIVGSFDGDVLQPLVMGKAVSLHPLAIIILIAIGSITLGIIGALVAVPIGAAIYRVMKYLTGRDPDHPQPGAPPPTTDGTPAKAESAPQPAGSPAGQ